MTDTVPSEIEGFPELELSKEEEALLARMEAEETGEPVADPEPAKEPETEPAKEPETEPEPVKEPGEEPEPVQAEEPEGEPEPEPRKFTTEELLERMDKQEREIAGLRGDLFKERDRRRTAEAATPDPETATETAKLPTGVEIELNDEGNYQVPLEALTDTLRRQGWTAPQGQTTNPAIPGPDGLPQGQVYQPPPAEMDDPRRVLFEQIRAGIIQESETPLETGQAMDELLEATIFLDQRVGEELPRVQGLDQLPQGIGRIVHIVENTNIGKELQEKYPGLDVADLSSAALSLDPHLVRRTLRNYMGARGEKPAVDDTPDPKADELAERRRKLSDRPRSMAKKGQSGKRNVPNAEQFADLSAQDVFDMSDEDMAEMERLAKGDS